MRKNKGLDFRKKRRKRINIGVFKEIFSWLFWILVSMFTAVVLMYVFGVRTNLIGNSMEPGLHSGQHILINRLIYQVSAPKRGDIIAFQPNGNENSHYYIKRIVGLPGETIQVVNGYVYIDGKMLNEDGDFDKIKDPGIAINEIKLGDDEFFVLGDNRNFSEDSRAGNIGTVNKEYMIGKVWFKLSTKLDNLGFVK